MALRLAADQATGRVLVILVAVIAVGALLAPTGAVPQLVMLGPLAYFVALVGNAGAAVVLLTTLSTSPSQRSTFVLALSFTVSAGIMLVAILVLAIIPDQPAFIVAPSQTGIWLFVLWHVNIAMGALIYVVLRRSDTGKPLSSRFVAITIVVANSAFLIVLAIAFQASMRLPHLAAGRSVSGLATTGVGPVTVLLLGVAAALVLRLRGASPIERALAISLVTLTVGVALFVIGGHRYTATFYAGRGLMLMGSVFVFIAAVRTLIILRYRLGEVEGALSRVEGESAQRAGRIRAVWEIASKDEFNDKDRCDAILQIATAALRPGMPIFGSLSHIDGDQLVFDATASAGPNATAQTFSDGIFPGAKVTYDRTMQSLLGSSARATLAWNDLGLLVDRGMFFENVGIRSFVGTPLLIGRQTHFVAFSSSQSAELDPFTEEDIAFVDVVAAFISNRFNQEKQFERIQFQMDHDALTGLENRVQFRKAVRDEILAGLPCAVAFVDLDGFRHVNEREGHQIGDELLVEVAAGLLSVDTNDFVARMSADEFGILVRGTANAAAAGIALAAYAELFLAAFHTGDRYGTRMLGIGASIGAACFPADGSSAEALMGRADVALDVAKARAGSAAVVFDKEMESIVADVQLRVVELSAAIARDELALVYQPTFDLATRRITGAEALVRWDHPERGRLPPSDFVPFAEHNGMIGALSRWVFRRTVRDLSSVPVLPASFRTYFNLAPQMLDDVPFIAELRAVLDANPRLIDHLGIEVTETAAMQNVERSMHTIDMFRAWGLTVAIDDFGTGYSSLSYLNELTVDVIKIDRSFVMKLPADERADAITEMLLRITDTFGFASLAEGIETEEQAAWLLEHGCRYGQGFLVARPASFAELLEQL
jgi:diguanylate cyclase (GGDEF)-like protein